MTTNTSRSTGAGIRRELRNAFSIFCIVQFFIILVLTIYSYHYSEDQTFARIVESEHGVIQEYASLKEVPPVWQARLEPLAPGTYELSGDDSDELAGTELHTRIFVDENGSKRYRILALAERESSRSLVVAYSLFAFLCAAAMGIFALWASRYLVRRVSAPLENLANKLSAHRPGDPKPDFADIPATGEVGLVVAHLDRSFDRVTQTLDRERVFARNVSHELRTPLTVIRTAIDNAVDGTVDQRRQAMSRARRAIEDMDLLTTACLGLARDRPTTDAEQSISIDRLTKSIVTENLYLLDGKNVDLDVRIETHNPQITGDEGLARMAVGNLVRNAFIHCPGGVIDIVVNESGVRVTNTAAEADNAAFEPMTQSFVNAPDKDGHGLGLTILGQSCRRLGWSTRTSLKDSSVTIALDFASI